MAGTKPVLRRVEDQAADGERTGSAGNGRSLGRFADQIAMAADFDAPLPEDIAAAFRGYDGPLVD